MPTDSSTQGDNLHHPSPRAIGLVGEEVALRSLSGRGFVLITRNWRPQGRAGKTELDLVGMWDKTLVFVEVKTRRMANTDPFEPPAGLHNFSTVKRRNMVRAARAYLTEQDRWGTPCRFDLVCVTLVPDTQPQVDHYCNVIELGQTLDRGNAAWQPW